MSKIGIVIPTIREDCIIKFLDKWQFGDAQIYIIEDNPKSTFKLPEASGNSQIHHYAWDFIDTVLDKDAWIISRRSSAIRCFGYYMAYKDGCDYIITLDDDCYPLEENHWGGLVNGHIDQLNKKLSRWLWTTKGVKPRGVPYFNLGNMATLINMGFWRNVADLDAPCQLAHGAIDLEPEIWNPVPPLFYAPICAMNLSFKHKAVPMMYSLLMGEKWNMDRFDDIWSGIIAKKICDHLGYLVRAGTPAVRHERASDVWKNLNKELIGLQLNESFWEIIDGIKFSDRAKDINSSYFEVADYLEKHTEKYLATFGKAMKIWLNIF